MPEIFRFSVDSRDKNPERMERIRHLLKAYRNGVKDAPEIAGYIGLSRIELEQAIDTGSIPPLSGRGTDVTLGLSNDEILFHLKDEYGDFRGRKHLIYDRLKKKRRSVSSSKAPKIFAQNDAKVAAQAQSLLGRLGLGFDSQDLWDAATMVLFENPAEPGFQEANKVLSARGSSEDELNAVINDARNFSGFLATLNSRQIQPYQNLGSRHILKSKTGLPVGALEGLKPLGRNEQEYLISLQRSIK